MSNRLLILDGGLGHQLKSKGIDKIAASAGLKYEEFFASGTLANSEQFELVLDAHTDFVKAGADVITTNSFGCTEFTLGKIGKAEYATSLAGAAGKIARQAASSAGRDITVAGSLPPLLESYQTRDLYAFEEMQPRYRELVTALAPHVDIFLCETMSTISEALAAGSVCSETGKPWWCSFTLEDTTHAHLRSGERLIDAVKAIQELPGLECICLNCCAPQSISAAMPILREATPERIQVGAYANGFQTTTSEWLAQGSDYKHQLESKPEEYGKDGIVLAEAYKRYAEDWVKNGATVIGGCCGIGPEHISKLCELKKVTQLL